MREYRAYIIGPNGHIQERIDLICADDQSARECAKNLVYSRDVELWRFDRWIAEFKRK
jgi:hypothetical protein